MTKKLFGTDPDQVPFNSDLGTLAYQNAESVRVDNLVIDGAVTGGISTDNLDLTAISSTIAATAVDVFVYDTSRDSDGGAWRKRTQHTSWYNEELNTPTRGSRKEFPAVAIIVAETFKIIIYDGDDPALPMWMVFVNSAYSLINMNGGSYIRAITALNGKLSFATNVGEKHVNYISDNYGTIGVAFNYEGVPFVSKRNDDIGISGYTAHLLSTPRIVNNDVADVAMTVLPNAPIDPATGLPIPTIAVGTIGGVSIIKDDGTVVNWLTNVGYASNVFFTDNGGIQVHGGGGVAYGAWGLNDIPATTTNGFDYIINNGGWDSTKIVRQGGSGNSVLHPAIALKGGSANSEAAGASTTNKLMLINKNNIEYGNSLVSYVTSKYNTGWMPGNIKGAWLSDNTQETVIGAELVTNGTFNTDTSGWTEYSGATLSIDAGRLKITENSGDGQYGVFQTLTTVAGKRYVVSFDIELGTSATTTFYIGDADWGGGSKTISSNGTYSYTFTAGDTSSILYIHTIYAAAASYFLIDNVSVRLAEADRSVNNKGLQVFGAITKTPVAAGTDLVAYSGFSGSNYLQQSYNSALDFGTGDFSMMGWIKWNGDTTYDFFTRQATSGSGYGTAAGFYLKLGNTGNLQVGLNSDGSSSWPTALASISSGFITTWTHICVVRRSGTIYIYRDGTYKGGGVNATNVTSTSGNSRIFVGAIMYNNGISGFNGSMSMWRISATAPSDEQIKKIYEDEKFLFQDNAQSTLYGTSDAITALAYDDKTNLLHVGTSSGRSVFQGLRRIDNTTTAVGTAISAYDSLVVEE